MEPLFPGIARKSGNPISDFINLPSSYFRGQQAPASLKRVTDSLADLHGGNFRGQQAPASLKRHHSRALQPYIGGFLQ